MKHTLLLVGLAFGLAQSALAWGLGDLANAAQSLSGKSKCKVCEKQIRKGDIGFDEGFKVYMAQFSNGGQTVYVPYLRRHDFVQIQKFNSELKVSKEN